MTEDERRAIEADCERLIKHYANLGDAGDWPAVAALYTEDARFARPSQPGAFIDGRRLFNTSLGQMPSFPLPAGARPPLEKPEVPIQLTIAENSTSTP